jgi:hypothetical protein
LKIPKPDLPVLDIRVPKRRPGEQTQLTDKLQSKKKKDDDPDVVCIIPPFAKLPVPASIAMQRMTSHSLSRLNSDRQGTFSIHARVCYVSTPVFIDIAGKRPFHVCNVLLNGGNDLITRLAIFGNDPSAHAKNSLIIDKVYEFTSVHIEKSASKSTRLPVIGFTLACDDKVTWKELDLDLPRDCTINKSISYVPELSSPYFVNCCDVCGILLCLTEPLPTKRGGIFRKVAIAINDTEAVLIMIWDGIIVTAIEGMKIGDFIGIKNVVFMPRKEGDRYATLQVTDTSMLVKKVAGRAFLDFAANVAHVIRANYTRFNATITSMKLSMTLDCTVDKVLVNLMEPEGYRSFRILGLISSIDGIAGNTLHYMGCDEPGCTPKKIIVDTETGNGHCPKCGVANGRVKSVPFARITIVDFIGAVNVNVMFREELFEKLFRCKFSVYVDMLENEEGERRKNEMIERTAWEEVMVVIRHSPASDPFPEKLILVDLVYPTPEECMAFMAPLISQLERENSFDMPETQLQFYSED